MYYIDYHTHTHFSVDSNADIDEMCVAAINKGMNELAFTDHFEPAAADVFCRKTYDELEIKKAIAQAKDKYKDKIKIIYGIEIGQIHKYPQAAKNVLENDFDFVIGSLHNILNDIDLEKIEYTAESCNKIFKQYLKELKLCVSNTDYDCVGHLDYPKRYVARSGYAIDINDYIDEIREILKIVIDNGRGIEVNCSGLRQAINDTLPSFNILKLYKKLGGEIITVGSDAHNPRDVGVGIEDAYKRLALAGFKYITTFEKRCARFILI